MPSAIAPPTRGPSATAIAVPALNRPIAAPRFSGGKAAVKSVSPSVSTSAAPAPGRPGPPRGSRRRAAGRPPPAAGGGGARRGGGGERAQSDRVKGRAAVAIAQRSGGDQQHREAQVVGVD